MSDSNFDFETTVRSDALGEQLNETYRVLSIINSGGMGVIYKAKHLLLDKFVAIKMLKSGHYNEKTLQRFQREGQIASALSHPNIVTVYDFGINETGQPFMVMEFVQGISLAERISFHGSLSPIEAISVGSQVCDALDHAHRKGILHRDIKPGNIMLVGKLLEAKVVDFGIAKNLAAQDKGQVALTNANQALGSPLYMSPEQASSQSIDARSDLYSLGCVLFECLTGKTPFRGETAIDTMMMRVNTKAPTISQAAPDRKFPPSLEQTVAKLLERDPVARYQSASDAKAALDSICPSETGEGKDTFSLPAQTTPVPNLQRKHVVFLLLFAVAGLIWCFTSTIKPTPLPQPADSTTSSSETTDELWSNAGEILNLPSGEGRPEQPTKQIFLSDTLLDATDCPLKDSDLPGLLKNPNLNDVRVSRTMLTSKGFETIASLDGLLTLQANQTVLDNQAVVELSRLKNLIGLHVCGTTLDDGCTPYLARMKSISQLSISDTKISDEGLRNLAPLKNLQFLQVSRTSISDSGIEFIAENFPNLKVLQARANPKITEKSLLYLAKMPSLRRLTLTGCSIPPARLRSFFWKHPELAEHQNRVEMMFTP